MLDLDRPTAVLHPPTTRRRADEWALVLTSQSIPSRVLPTESGWVIAVAPEDAGRAAASLGLYVHENADDAGVKMPSDTAPRTWVGVPVAVLILAFFALTGPRENGAWWFLAGRADAGRMLDGEWWRAITALTLHADIGHAASNAAAGGLFLTLLGRAVGGGAALLAALAAGILGNLTNVWVRGAPFAGVGASTAVFGAVGALAGARVARPSPKRAAGGRWLPVAAGIALLALLGASETTDVLAHALGFAWGLPAGFAAARLSDWVSRRAGRFGLGWQVAAGLTTAVVVVSAWLVASAAR